MWSDLRRCPHAKWIGTSPCSRPSNRQRPLTLRSTTPYTKNLNNSNAARWPERLPRTVLIRLAKDRPRPSLVEPTASPTPKDRLITWSPRLDPTGLPDAERRLRKPHGNDTSTG